MNSAIVLAGGMGKRMMSKVSKQYLKVLDKPILYYSIKAFDEHPDISEIVIVIRKGEEELFESEVFSKYIFNKNIKITRGGSTRTESVKNGLNLLDRDSDTVLIHDGVRPFINKRIIDENIKACSDSGSCITAVKSKDTVKLSDSDMNVLETLPRERIFLAQTPQTFKKSIIIEAFEKIDLKDHTITDDSMIAERLGIKVKIVEGSYENIKITTPEDLFTAEQIAKDRRL